MAFLNFSVFVYILKEIILGKAFCVTYFAQLATPVALEHLFMTVQYFIENYAHLVGHLGCFQFSTIIIAN